MALAPVAAADTAAAPARAVDASTPGAEAPVPGAEALVPGAAAPVPAPVTLCRTADRRLAELSGLATDGGTGRWAIVDGGGRPRVYRLGDDCAVGAVQTLPVRARDVEDLARTPDGTLWLADIGDNERGRDTVALHLLAADGRVDSYRLRYRDGPHDAEALLVGRDRVPLVVTKELLGPAGVYRPERPLDRAATTGVTTLRRVADVALPESDTPGGPLQGVGSRLVTGGATTAAGTVAAVRTYTDAWLFAAPDGDLAAALSGDPVRVPLPGEPQGEAIAFDGGGLLSGSERRGGVVGELRVVRGAADLARSAYGSAPAAPAPATGRSVHVGVEVGGPLVAGALLLAGLVAVVVVVLTRRLLRRRAG